MASPDGATHPPPQPPPSNTTTQTSKTLLIGLSGPSSSGKTTLARLLAQIFTLPPTPTNHNRSTTLFILHEDDFYKTDALVPLTTTSPTCPSGLGPRTLQDWDCLGSLDLPLFHHTLSHVKARGTLPEDSHSKEDQNSVGPVPISAALVPALRAAAVAWLEALPTAALAEGTHLRICVLDGFLLYVSPGAAQADAEATALREIAGLLDLKLLVLCGREQTIERRTRRAGYVTLEGFWADPEGYVEDVVWPNYVRDHAWLMREQGNGEGREGKEGDMLDVDGDVARSEGLSVAPGRGEAGLDVLLEWAVAEVKRALEGGAVESQGSER